MQSNLINTAAFSPVKGASARSERGEEMQSNLINTAALAGCNGGEHEGKLFQQFTWAARKPFIRLRQAAPLFRRAEILPPG